MDLYQRITNQVDDLRQDQIREMGLVNADGLPSTEALVDQIIFNDHSDSRSKRKPEEKAVSSGSSAFEYILAKLVQALDKVMKRSKIMRNQGDGGLATSFYRFNQWLKLPFINQ